MKKDKNFLTTRIFFSFLLLFSLTDMGCNSEAKEKAKLKEDFQLAIEKKDFSTAFESYYKLKSLLGDIIFKGYTEKLISARIPYLLFENEYATALRELVEFNYWESYGASSDEFEFVNGFILKIFDNAIENRDIEASRRTLKYYRSYYKESYNHKSLSGDYKNTNHWEASDYNQEIMKYNEQIAVSLSAMKSSIDKELLFDFFDTWIKPVYKIEEIPTGNGLETKILVTGYDDEYIKQLRNKLI